MYAGAERVLEQMLRVFPQADVFSLIEFLPDDQRAFLGGRDVRTSFIQRLPFARRHYRLYLPFAPVAIEQFDLRGYDIVLSSSYVVAKGVLTTPDQMHVSYVHSPIRYAWDLYFDYLENGGLTRGVRSALARLILHYMRLYDSSTAGRVDFFLANSNHVARRINKTYRRTADVVYPPVDTTSFVPSAEREDYFFTMSRLVPYKRIDLIVRAFSQLPEERLVVIGDGPEMEKIRGCAGPNVSLMGFQSNDVVRRTMSRAKAFVFAAEEDFGIVPVEAQACGVPVIAFGAGGARETILDGVTGVFFQQQTEASLIGAVERFKSMHFDGDAVRRHAETFSEARFRSRLLEAVDRHYAAFRSEANDAAPENV
ncbi:MAG: glycosyltransferase family 4 protein [Rhodothermales bacterium]